jgi:tyrosine-protein kinase Etk/Wzc
MYDVMQRLSNDYQFVLLDSAPVASASDTLGLATMVDGVVVVAGPSTPKQTIRSVCRRLFDAGATVFGVVVNGVDIRNSSFVDATRYSERYGEYADSPEAVLRPDLHAAEG